MPRDLSWYFLTPSEYTCRLAAELRKQREHFPMEFWPSVESAERVFSDLVNDNNRDVLRRELHNFRVAYLEYVSNKGPKHKARKRKMNSIARHARALLKLLSNPEDRLLEYYLWLFSPLSRNELLFQLGELSKTAGTPLPAPKNAVKEWCVQKLADICEEHFKDRASVKRPSALDIGGPFPQFVEAVSKEIGIEISPETIAPALAKRRRIVKT
jgi:hypothetical protein